MRALLSDVGRVLPAEFVRETHELMLRRARVGIVLASYGTLAFVLVDFGRVATVRFPAAAGVRVGGIVLLLALLAAARGRNAARWSHWIAGVALTVLLTTVIAIMRFFGGVLDPNYAIQGTGLVLCILGSALLLPFTAGQMLAVGLVGLALHVAFTADFPLVHNFPVLFSTLSSVVIATVGARELTRARLAEFEGRRAKEDLVRARSDFVAMLTHDIKNPLSVIDGYVEMIRENPDMPSGEREELHSHMQRSVRTAIALAANFLDASKIEADRVVLNKEMIHVGDLLNAAVSDQRPSAEHKGVRLLNDCDADLPTVDADAGALGRVFANLLGNAIKHTPRGGTVRVSASLSAGDQIAVTVEDTGGGIPLGQESRIFDRYTGAANRVDSTGLGLFIAQTFTAAHGGTIRAENRTDRSGARFCVDLPSTPAK